MKIGSIAIALSAEYGEFCPSAISFSGRSWTKSNPAADIHWPSRTTSGISPIPQLSRDGIENSGTRTPACRPWKKSRAIDTLQKALHAGRKRRWLGQQADHQVGLAREVEEEPRMHDDIVALEQLQDERFFTIA